MCEECRVFFVCWIRRRIFARCHHPTTRAAWKNNNFTANTYSHTQIKNKLLLASSQAFHLSTPTYVLTAFMRIAMDGVASASFQFTIAFPMWFSPNDLVFYLLLLLLLLLLFTLAFSHLLRSLESSCAISMSLHLHMHIRFGVCVFLQSSPFLVSILSISKPRFFPSFIWKSSIYTDKHTTHTSNTQSSKLIQISSSHYNRRASQHRWCAFRAVWCE